MKKGLFLLTSFLVTGTAAVAPVLTETKAQDVTFEAKTSLDVVDLTMPWWQTIKVSAPNLTQLLNDSVTPGSFPLQSSKMMLTSPDNIIIEAVSAFDNGSLRSLLGRNVHFTDVKLEFSSQHSYANYVMAYYTNVDSNGTEAESALVINRFNWSTIDKIDHFWTSDVKFEFELTF